MLVYKAVAMKLGIARVGTTIVAGTAFGAGNVLSEAASTILHIPQHIIEQVKDNVDQYNLPKVPGSFAIFLDALFRANWLRASFAYDEGGESDHDTDIASVVNSLNTFVIMSTLLWAQFLAEGCAGESVSLIPEASLMFIYLAECCMFSVCTFICIIMLLALGQTESTFEGYMLIKMLPLRVPCAYSAVLVRLVLHRCARAPSATLAPQTPALRRATTSI